MAETPTPEQIERAWRAFGDALCTRVNMATPLGHMPAQALREAMAEALKAVFTDQQSAR
jgi:hypothetical protein